MISSAHLWVASIMSLIVQWSGVIIAGMMLIPSEIAFLTVALRTAMLTSFALVIVNLVMAPKYALMWKNNNIEKLKKTAKISSRILIIIATPIILILVFASKAIMGLFGEQYSNFNLLLVVLSLGQFVNIATGSVGYLLTMSGHESDFNKITLMAGPITIIMVYVLTINYGVYGTAIGTAIGIAIQNLGAFLMVKKRLSFYPI